jgi:D-3-phosphoglycerate dehydrogenase
MSKKVLIATEKPFAGAARDAVVKTITAAGLEAKLLESYTNPADLLAAVADADALIVRSDKVTDAVLSAGKNLKIVVRAGAGYDNVDCAAAKAKMVVVMNTPGQNANAVAELAIGMMIMMARGKYSGKSGTEVSGKTLGLHGFGAVARRVAAIARQGFGMKILAFDPFVPAAKMKEAGAEAAPLETLFEKSDYISLHVPLLPATERSINYNLMKRMKKGAALINTARAEVVNEADLLKIYAERPDIKYASDITPLNQKEMVACDGNRCFFTPKKMGAQTAEANFNAGVAAAKQIIAFFEKGDTTYQVNK